MDYKAARLFKGKWYCINKGSNSAVQLTPMLEMPTEFLGSCQGSRCQWQKKKNIALTSGYCWFSTKNEKGTMSCSNMHE